MKGFLSVLTARSPGLVEKIRSAITAAERAFAGNTPDADGSFLWEHSVHVAGLAFRLAESEGLSAVPAAIAALLHDAGKFRDGRYHEDGVAEEETAARLAEGLLRGVRLRAGERSAVLRALRALYNEAGEGDPLADVIHDADFLSKSGFLGVAAFFTKSALRGQTLGVTVARSLSKDLTYAACLPANMRTRSARALAGRKAADTAAFYEGFLAELREVHGLDFAIHRIEISDPRRPGAVIDVRFVLPGSCEACGDRWTFESGTSRGLKCDKLDLRAVCRRCGSSFEISFCLPEIPSAGRVPDEKPDP